MAEASTRLDAAGASGAWAAAVAEATANATAQTATRVPLVRNAPPPYRSRYARQCPVSAALDARNLGMVTGHREFGHTRYGRSVTFPPGANLNHETTQLATRDSVKDATDSALMRQVRTGQTAALATLFERHHARLYRYCLRMTGQGPSAEDLVQDVFMKMLKYKATFRDDSEFVPWMFGIGRNACLAHLRRAATYPAPAEDLDATPAPDMHVDDRHGNEQQSELVRRALLKLPVERREVLVLSRYEFKSYDEIARLLDCSVGAVKVRVHRAIKELREIYLDMTGETST